MSLAQSCIASWNFENAAIGNITTVTDDTGNGHTLSIQNGTPQIQNTVIGKPNKTYYAPTAAGLVTPSPISHDLSFAGGNPDKPFSIEYWVNPAVVNNIQFLGKLNASAFEWRSFNSSSALLTFQLLTNSTNAINCITNSAMPTNVWLHIIHTYNGLGVASGLKTYVNGAVAATTNTMGGTYTGMTNTASPLYIGTQYNNVNRLTGYMDNIIIWGTELTASQAKARYNNGKGAPYNAVQGGLFFGL